MIKAVAKIVIGATIILCSFQYVYNTQEQLNEKDVQISSLQKEAVGLKAEINATNDTITAYKEHTSLLEKEITALEGKLQGLPKQKYVGNFQVTWYTGDTITASGHPTLDEVTVSVDPNVIKPGSWIKIVMPNGQVMYRRADDTGGAVKGNILDVYTKNGNTKQLGRTHGAKVYVLGGN